MNEIIAKTNLMSLFIILLGNQYVEVPQKLNNCKCQTKLDIDKEVLK